MLYPSEASRKPLEAILAALERSCAGLGGPAWSAVGFYGLFEGLKPFYQLFLLAYL